jgi:hypothetical protein
MSIISILFKSPVSLYEDRKLLKVELISPPLHYVLMRVVERGDSECWKLDR